VGVVIVDMATKPPPGDDARCTCRFFGAKLPVRIPPERINGRGLESRAGESAATGVHEGKFCQLSYAGGVYEGGAAASTARFLLPAEPRRDERAHQIPHCPSESRLPARRRPQRGPPRGDFSCLLRARFFKKPSGEAVFSLSRRRLWFAAKRGHLWGNNRPRAGSASSEREVV
jgi:hypothetical protein